MFGTATEQQDDHAICTNGGNACHVRNGYMALLELTKPENGGYIDPAVEDSSFVLDKRDRDWKKLRLWIDENRDGIAQQEELHTLEEFGIHSISTMPAMSYWEDQWGNSFRYTAPLNVDATEVRKWANDHQDKGKIDTQTYDVWIRNNKFVRAIKVGNGWACPEGYGNISYGDPLAIPTCQRSK